MWYVILGHDYSDALSRRRAARAVHLERVALLKNEGRVLAAGPLPKIDAADPGAAGFSGSLIIAEFDSIEAARSWAAQDAYIAERVWSRVDVWPYIKVI